MELQAFGHFTLTAVLLSCLGSGCSTLSNASVGGHLNAGEAQAVRLTYRMDAGQMGAPLAISCVQAQQVAYQEVEASPIAERSIGVLDIQYPHPADRPGMALVGVVIQRQQGPERGVPPQFIQRVRGWFRWPDEELIVGSNRDLHEAWVMDVPKAELDQILTGLRNDGYYADGERRRGHVRLTSWIGNERTSKDWSSVSDLDGLMHRVRAQGQLVSYQGIAMPLQNRPTAPASVVAWRAVQEDQPGPNPGLAGPGQTAPVSTPQQALFQAPHASSQPPQMARLPQANPWQ